MKLVSVPIVTAMISRRGKRSVSRYAVAPGVTTMQITRKAPTVCSAATVDAESSVKKVILSARVLSPSVRAWCSSKKVTSRSFHLTSSTASETTPMIVSWRVSLGVIASTLPSTID